MKRLSILAACLIVGLFAGLAFGQGPPQERRGRHHNFAHLLKRADTNGDGSISRDEWKRRPEAFGRLDLNDDGSITRDEAEAAGRRLSERAGKRGGKAFRRLDNNHDGQISRDEWTGTPEMFDRLDRNHDGSITRDEAEAAGRRLSGRAGKRGQKAFQRFDSNHDGQINRDEWTGPTEMFDRLDRNHDGSITRDELASRGGRGRSRRPDGPSSAAPQSQPAQ